MLVVDGAFFTTIGVGRNRLVPMRTVFTDVSYDRRLGRAEREYCNDGLLPALRWPAVTTQACRGDRWRQVGCRSGCDVKRESELYKLNVIGL